MSPCVPHVPHMSPHVPPGISPHHLQPAVFPLARRGQGSRARPARVPLAFEPRPGAGRAAAWSSVLTCHRHLGVHLASNKSHPGQQPRDVGPDFLSTADNNRQLISCPKLGSPAKLKESEKSQRGRARGHRQTSQTESSHTCAHVARPARLDGEEEKEGTRSSGANAQTPGHAPVFPPPSLCYRLGSTLCAGRPVPGGAASGPGFSPPRWSPSSHRQGASMWGEGEGRALPEQGCWGRPREKAVCPWAGPGPRGLGASSHLPPEGELGPSPASDARALEHSKPRAGCWAACVVSVFSPVRRGHGHGWSLG
ncbi:translation initiation factor IF-2-like [Mustela erminea]|uniref:translation initiation factor IF-2-like n=1 Tax=Mustela erminea TaxID=36723 RepID=UPI0013870F82|nr:translation initiation factor IF-2-like [Mustela erminea]